jgi:hypothetical protein
MARKKQPTTPGGGAAPRSLPRGIVAFHFQDSTYQIDMVRQKVYQSWVEVGRNRQVAIISAYRDASGPSGLELI